MRESGKFSWCCKQVRGIKLIELNNLLSDSYMLDADKTFDNFLSASGKWRVITATSAKIEEVRGILKNE